MRFVSIDIETTGLNPTTCQILELAAVVEDTNVPGTIAQFEAIVGHERIVGEPFAINMNMRLIGAIAAMKAPLPDARYVLMEFAEFLSKHVGENGIVPAGKNFAGFDKLFIENSHAELGPAIVKRFTHRVLDPGSMYAVSTDFRPPDLSECLRRAGMPSTVSHCALDDARQVASLVRQFLISNEQ